MMRRTLLQALVLASVHVSFVSVAWSATQIEVVTFNMKWFGVRVNDPRGNPSPIDPAKIQQKTKIMRDFMTTIVQPRDLAIFEEVVDVPLLKQVLPQGWNCLSYPTRNPHHQHVVLCAAGKYKFLPVPYDRDAIIEEIAIDPEWGRPGVRADLADRTGKRLLRVVGLHLKSAPEFSKERVMQMQMVARDLAKDHTVPTLITGDLNTYWPKDTGLKFPDVTYMENELRKFDTSFRHIEHTSEFTFRSERFHSQFDHLYINGQVRLINGPSVFKVCNQTRNGTGYYNFPFYYENVSDHCAVKAMIEVQ